jgi:hypothetical protein
MKITRNKNSMLPQADTKVVDLYVAKANNDNYLDILKEIAKELGEHFDVRKEFDTPNEFRAWAEKNDKISDRMYIVLDYVLGAVTGMKKGERQANNRVASVDIDLVKGFTIGDLTIKKIGNKYHLEAPMNSGYAAEKLTSEDPDYVIKTILSRMSNFGIDTKQLNSRTRQVNADISNYIPELNRQLEPQKCKAVWDSENDQIEIKGKGSDIITIKYDGDHILLSRWDDVVFMSRDMKKIVDELKTQINKN